MKKRFLVLSQYYAPEVGAPQVRLGAFSQGLQRLGHEVEVVTALPNYPAGQIFPSYQGAVYRSEENDGIPIHRVWLHAATGIGARRAFNYGTFAVMSLLGLMRCRRPDYIFVESPPLFLGVPAYWAAIRWRVPFIFNVADLWPDSIRELGVMRDGLMLRFLEQLEHWTYRRAAFVTAVTQGIRQALVEEKGVPEDKVLFLPNGVDLDLFNPHSADHELAHELNLQDKKVIVYAGTLGYAQGLDVMLHALERLSGQVNDVVFVFLGAGPEKERLKQLAGTLNLTNVWFLDPRPPSFVARLYSISYAGFASLKALPLFEGARPSKLLPIMGAGKPVLYSGSGEGARLIQEARAGCVVPPEDPTSLANALLMLCENPKMAAAMGCQGRKYAEEHLGWASLIETWLDELHRKSQRPH